MNSTKRNFSKNKFSSHTKTQRHKKWLSILNQNKSNYYVENITPFNI